MGKKRDPDSRKLYAIYDSATDELLAFGNAEQCAKLLNYKNEGSFRKTLWFVETGKIKKYVVVKMDGYGDDGEDG